MSDSTRSYRPGGWFGIFGDHATVLLPPSEKARVAQLWELVDEGAGFDEVLDALISSGLRELPGFVLVSERESDTKVVIRGAARAAFTTESETVELEGSAATTWVERSLEGVTTMVVEVEEVSAEGEDHAISSGLVRVGRVDAPPYSPEPAAEPDEDAGSAGVATELHDRPDAESEPEPEPESEPETRAVIIPPWPSRVAPVADEPEPEPEPEPADPMSDTAAHPVPGFGPPPPVPVPVPDVPEPPIPSAPAPPVTDHDGMTRAAEHDPAQFTPPQPGIPGQPPAPSITRPVARLVFSSGQAVEVDRAILVGRAPEARRFPSDEQPRLVTVPSPHQEISGTHLEVRPGSGADHGTAVVTDLGSTNGSVLVQPGLPPEDLQPGITVQLIPGAIIDLGDGITIQVVKP